MDERISLRKDRPSSVIVAVISMLLLIDNYDSFVHNLARYLRELGAEGWKALLKP